MGSSVLTVTESWRATVSRFTRFSRLTMGFFSSPSDLNESSSSSDFSTFAGVFRFFEAGVLGAAPSPAFLGVAGAGVMSCALRRRSYLLALEEGLLGLRGGEGREKLTPQPC